jgi:PAS domain S-box-containing protein
MSAMQLMLESWMLGKTGSFDSLSTEHEITLILEGIGEGFYAVGADWRIRLFNTDAEKHFGLARAEVLGKVLWTLFPSARETGLGRTFRRVMESRETINSEEQSVLFPGRWMEYRLFPLGDGMGVRFRDITERKRGEELRQLLLNELNHRVKNTLAAVQSIARQTLRGAGSVAEADTALGDRLLALAKAHDALTRENWQGTDLAEIVATATTEPYGAKRFTVSGDPVRLSPAQSLALTLAMHELATNAAKYGALKSPDGHVVIAWEVAADGPKRQLTLRWSERGGPPVTPPTRRGFGTRMIERSFASEFRGSARADYAQGGVAWTIEMPLQPV